MRLKKIREEKHYSQKELSAFLGVRQNTYSQYETGARQIPIEALIKLSAFYDVSVDYLLGLTEIEDRYSAAK
ncbi:MAG: helix-turn-helix transcriptional regulator [Clostridia bacterium]|nr:helix-turn-helix transcriptional regulator [Clostridia bacterium]